MQLDAAYRKKVSLYYAGFNRTPEAWAGVIIAGFSKQWKAGLWQQFERKKISKGHAWRVRLAT